MAARPPALPGVPRQIRHYWMRRLPLAPLLGQVSFEGDHAGGGSGETFSPRARSLPPSRALLAALQFELGVEKEIDLLGGDPQDGLLPGDQPLLGHVHGDANGRLGGALAGTGLEHPELAFSMVNSMSCISR